MKGKIMTIVAMMMLLVSLKAAFAVGDDLSEQTIGMNMTDSAVVQYCMNGVKPAYGYARIVVSPICKDVDGQSGCQVGDILNQNEFTVTPLQQTMQIIDGQGCVDLVLHTSNADGKYYYTVNGKVGCAKVSSETGTAYVIPEFGVLGALAVLGMAGVFVVRKRK